MRRSLSARDAAAGAGGGNGKDKSASSSCSSSSGGGNGGAQGSGNKVFPKVQKVTVAASAPQALSSDPHRLPAHVGVARVAGPRPRRPPLPPRPPPAPAQIARQDTIEEIVELDDGRTGSGRVMASTSQILSWLGEISDERAFNSYNDGESDADDTVLPGTNLRKVDSYDSGILRSELRLNEASTLSLPGAPSAGTSPGAASCASPPPARPQAASRVRGPAGLRGPAAAPAAAAPGAAARGPRRRWGSSPRSHKENHRQHHGLQRTIRKSCITI
ncbi:Protein of unknown function [Gryllus bimaculatus]|nr:Protein of unknown function [Gryllus bimaculatus]